MRNITGFNTRAPNKMQKELDDDLEAGVSPTADKEVAAAPPTSVSRDDELIIPGRMRYIVVSDVSDPRFYCSLRFAPP